MVFHNSPCYFQIGQTHSCGRILGYMPQGLNALPDGRTRQRRPDPCHTQQIIKTLAVKKQDKSYYLCRHGNPEPPGKGKGLAQKHKQQEPEQAPPLPGILFHTDITHHISSHNTQITCKNIRIFPCGINPVPEQRVGLTVYPEGICCAAKIMWPDPD